MRHFGSMLWALIRAHPILFVLLVVVIVLFLGGAVWAGVGFVLRAIRKVPGGSKVAGAVTAASAATGSA